MLAANIIQSSRSPWSFPIVVVDKRDGSKRFCTDFRKLNLICKRSNWPLPVIDDMLAVLGNSKYFTTLDLKSGYWQIPLDERDKEKTAFTCHRGLYEYNVMPSGLANAPGVFQEFMSVVLQDLGKIAMAYLDDIIIFSPSMEEHIKHIQLVFDRLRQHQLKLKISKCKFMQEETQYLGFLINRQGIMTDPDKVSVIKNMNPPSCVREVRSFIGVCSYFIDSSRIDPKKYAKYDYHYEDKQCNKEELGVPGFDLTVEQSKDKELVQLKENLQTEKASQATSSKYIILDNILYYLSKCDSDPVIGLYIPSHLKKLVIEQYHDQNGHMGIEKTYNAIKGKYYWLEMYKELYQYINSCVTCQQRNVKKVRPPQQETDAPPFPFVKLGLDISGPYPTTLSGNRYMISFVDWYSG